MAHWIIEDEGFGGTVYTCSACERCWNDLYSKIRLGRDTCPGCGEEMDDDETVYVEKKKRRFDIPLPDDITRRYAEIESQLATLSALTGYTLDDLIAKFAEGYVLTPPAKAGSLRDAMMCQSLTKKLNESNKENEWK